jgi:hypothetical protein
MVSCPLFPWTISSTATVDFCHIHSSSHLAVFDQIQGAGYFESEVETDAADLELETYAAALELEMNAAALKLETDAVVLNLETVTNMYQEISKQERYSAD